MYFGQLMLITQCNSVISFNEEIVTLTLHLYVAQGETPCTSLAIALCNDESRPTENAEQLLDCNVHGI